MVDASDLCSKELSLAMGEEGSSRYKLRITDTVGKIKARHIGYPAANLIDPGKKSVESTFPGFLRFYF